MSAPSSRLQELLMPMICRDFQVVLWHANGKELQPHLVAHLEYMIALEEEGVLFASGPLGERGKGDGLTILRVDSEAEARAIAEKDPFVVAGIRDFTILPWTLMEGSLRVDVRFSKQSMKFT